MRIKNPVHKQSEKACMCFQTRGVRTLNFTVSTHRGFDKRTEDLESRYIQKKQEGPNYQMYVHT